MGLVRTRLIGSPLALALLLVCPPADAASAETTNAPPVVGIETMAPELLKAYLQVQVQLEATQHTLDRNRQEAEAIANRNAEALDTRLRLLEQALIGERARELDSLERSQQIMLLFAGVFAGVGLLAILLSAYVHWRSTERLVGLGVALPALAAPASPAPIAPGPGRLLPIEQTERSNTRLLVVIEQLEKRILELEQTARPAVGPPSAPATTLAAAPVTATLSPEERGRLEAKRKAAQIELLLGKGQTLLDLDRAEEALGCFDKALTLDPRHPEVLVKKGAALEQVRKPDEAIACYDRAIATDQSYTMAYLQKGGLFNRLQRYEEALRCYEAALKCQERDSPGS